MPSFDIVSKTDLAEVDNALGNIVREINTRFDFKGSKCGIERKENDLTILADDALKLDQMHELLKIHLTRRKIDPGALEYKAVEKASGANVRQIVTVKQGISQDIAKTITRAVKDAKMKVQVAIQGNELRVSGKKRDDLQEAIALVRNLKIEQPLQFENFRD